MNKQILFLLTLFSINSFNSFAMEKDRYDAMSNYFEKDLQLVDEKTFDQLFEQFVQAEIKPVQLLSQQQNATQVNYNLMHNTMQTVLQEKLQGACMVAADKCSVLFSAPNNSYQLQIKNDENSKNITCLERFKGEAIFKPISPERAVKLLTENQLEKTLGLFKAWHHYQNPEIKMPLQKEVNSKIKPSGFSPKAMSIPLSTEDKTPDAKITESLKSLLAWFKTASNRNHCIIGQPEQYLKIEGKKLRMIDHVRQAYKNFKNPFSSTRVFQYDNKTNYLIDLGSVRETKIAEEYTNALIEGNFVYAPDYVQSEKSVLGLELSDKVGALIIGTQNPEACIVSNFVQQKLDPNYIHKETKRRPFVEDPKAGIWYKACISGDLILEKGRGKTLDIILQSSWHKNDQCPFTVFAHGNSSLIAVHTQDIHPDGLNRTNADRLKSEGKVSLNARDLARLIKTAPNYQAGQHIHLFSCECGADSNGIAQQLADEMKVPVSAFTGLSATFGLVFGSVSFENWRPQLKEIKTFYPREKSITNIDYLINY